MMSLNSSHSSGLRDSGPGAPARPGLRRKLQVWLDRARWRFAAGGERISADMTTLPRPGRGQALRDAHRTLSQRMHSHPAIRRVMPHLSCVERALAKHGSRALRKLPVPVLQRSLVQLSMLQRDDEPPMEAADLRVLRLRLMEAIALRSTRASGQRVNGHASSMAYSSAFNGQTSLPSGFESSSSADLSSGMSNGDLPSDGLSADEPASSGLPSGELSSGGLTLDDINDDDGPITDYDYHRTPHRRWRA